MFICGPLNRGRGAILGLTSRERFANLPHVARTAIKELDPVAELRAFVARFTSQADAAKALGVSAVYVSDLLNRRRDVSNNILAKLGLRWVVVK